MAGCHAVQLLKCSVKNCLIGKAAFSHHLSDRHVCTHEQPAGMGYTHLVYVLEKGNSHMLLEKTAEVFSAEASLGCYIIKRYFFFVVVIYIRNNITDSVVRLSLITYSFWRCIFRKIFNQISQHEQGDAIRLHGSGAFISDIGPGKLSGKLAKPDVF